MSRLRALPEEQPCHFRDGLGDRWLRTDGAGDIVEVLRPCRELAAMRTAIHDRFARLATLRLAQFVPVRDVDAAPNDDLGVEIVSDYIPGSRLSEILQATDAGRVVVSTDAALQVVRQVLGALAALHQSRAVTHGAIGPERLIVTPRGHVVISDCVLGLALERLNGSRARLWREFQIPMPLGADVPLFDRQADIAQVGFIAVALLAGRPLEPGEYPGRCSSLIDSLQWTDGEGVSVPISKALRAWLRSALRVDTLARFATARDAQMTLEVALSKRRRPASAEYPIKALVDDYDRARMHAGGETGPATGHVESRGGVRIPAPERLPPASGDCRDTSPGDVWPDRPAVFAPMRESRVAPHAAEGAQPDVPVFQPLSAPIRREPGLAVRPIRIPAKPGPIAVLRQAEPTSLGARRGLASVMSGLGPVLSAGGRAMLGGLAQVGRTATLVARGTARVAYRTARCVPNTARAAYGAGADVLHELESVLSGLGRVLSAGGRAMLGGLAEVGRTATLVARGTARVAYRTARCVPNTARAAFGVGAAMLRGLSWAVSRCGRAVGALGGVTGDGLVQVARGLARVVRGMTRGARGTAGAAYAVGVLMARGLAWLVGAGRRAGGAVGGAMAGGLAWLVGAGRRAGGAVGGAMLGGLAQGVRKATWVARAAGGAVAAAMPGAFRIVRTTSHAAWVGSAAALRATTRVFGAAIFSVRHARYPTIRPQFLFAALLAVVTWSGVQLAGAPWGGMLSPLITAVGSAAAKRNPAPVSLLASPGGGALHVQSEPSGAQVWVDGKLRGQTPLVLDRVKQGTHAVLLRHASGSVRTTVHVRGGETADMLVSIYSGWLAVFARAELQILEGDVVVGTTESGRILVRPGDHALELVNTRLGFRTTRNIEVKPGEVAVLNIDLPPAPLEIVAPPGSEIWVDGQLIGTAPIQIQSVAVGTCEVVMRHQALGERRQTTTVAYGTTNRIVFTSSS